MTYIMGTNVMLAIDYMRINSSVLTIIVSHTS